MNVHKELERGEDILFQAWCIKQEYDISKRLDGSGYNNPSTARAWLAWKAGRGAILFENSTLMGWKEVVDDELVVAHLGTADSFESPRKALDAIIEFSVTVATDPAVNGGKMLVDAQEYAALQARVKELEAMVPNSAQIVVDVALLRDLIDHARRFESFGDLWVTEQLSRLCALLPETQRHD